MNLSNLAIAVPVYIANESDLRAIYFRNTLYHLKQACRNWPVYFFVDGGDIGETVRHIRNARIPNFEIIVNATNIGLGLNLIKARRFCFERMKHDLVFVCESDVAVSKDIIPLLANILEWSKINYAWPAVASSSIVNYSNDPRHVTLHLMNWWNYLMPREVWDLISPSLTEFEQLLKGVAYKDRPHEAIQAWVKERFNMEDQGTCQDNINRVLCYVHGIAVWAALRNRALHIGEHGVNNNPEKHAFFGWDRQTLNAHPDDLAQHDFLRYGITGEPAPVDSSGGDYVPGPTVAPSSSDAV
jgi:hypothetical protein